jgi:hypothetical protein
MEATPSGADMLRRQIRVKDRVAELLRTYPQTKGDDLILIWHYFREFTNIRITYRQFRDLLHAPHPETIRRCRQLLQHNERELVEAGKLRLEDALYLPREKTIRKRRKLEEATHNYYGKGLKLTDFDTD